MSAESGPIGPEFGDEAEEQVADFRATRSGVTVRIGRRQAEVLRDLAGWMAELVEAGEQAPSDELAAMVGMSEHTVLPDDPILARLFPDGYSDDPDAAGEFRRFTESGLRSSKVAAAQELLRTIPASGGKVKLSADEAELWLRALNDVRLALGVMLDVTENFDEVTVGISETDPRYTSISIYQWLTYLQDSLVSALADRRLPSPPC